MKKFEVNNQKDIKADKKSEENTSIKPHTLIFCFIMLIMLFYFIRFKLKSKKIVSEINNNSLAVKLHNNEELIKNLNTTRCECYNIKQENNLQNTVYVLNQEDILNNNDAMGENYMSMTNERSENFEISIIQNNNENSSLSNIKQSLNNKGKDVRMNNNRPIQNTKLIEADNKLTKKIHQVLEKLEKLRKNYDEKSTICSFFRKLATLRFRIETILQIFKKNTWTDDFIHDKVSIFKEYREIKNLYLRSHDLKKCDLLQEVMKDLDELMQDINEKFKKLNIF